MQQQPQQPQITPAAKLTSSLQSFLIHEQSTVYTPHNLEHSSLISQMQKTNCAAFLIHAALNSLNLTFTTNEGMANIGTFIEANKTSVCIDSAMRSVFEKILTTDVTRGNVEELVSKSFGTENLLRVYAFLYSKAVGNQSLSASHASLPVALDSENLRRLNFNAHSIGVNHCLRASPEIIDIRMVNAITEPATRQRLSNRLSAFTQAFASLTKVAGQPTSSMYQLHVLSEIGEDVIPIPATVLEQSKTYLGQFNTATRWGDRPRFADRNASAFLTGLSDLIFDYMIENATIVPPAKPSAETKSETTSKKKKGVKKSDIEEESTVVPIGSKENEEEEVRIVYDHSKFDPDIAMRALLPQAIEIASRHPDSDMFHMAKLHNKILTEVIDAWSTEEPEHAFVKENVTASPQG